jgi:hypothetical protein
VLFEKVDENGLHKRHRRGWVDSTIADAKEIRRGVDDWFRLAQDGKDLWAAVNATEIRRVSIQCRKFID